MPRYTNHTMSPTAPANLMLQQAKRKTKKGGGGEEEYRKERGQINETSVSYEVASGLAVGTGISTDRVSSSLGETLPSDSTLVLKIVVDSGLAGSLVG